eukprot:CAMPEP_0180412926 /NCGR_PEP_ID=MMETSP0989-20121125/44803_1 /TAXON_ID=697907 /ORGANISM="non described non described, Strain CCMP2293" /LENGTH=97 /DNA_ID=CAMNT_0022417429 /DNA_START=39 /DNA_END=329 /DNA_ORIENTATION=+
MNVEAPATPRGNLEDPKKNWKEIEKEREQKMFKELKSSFAELFDSVYEAFVYFDHFGTNMISRTQLMRGLKTLDLMPLDMPHAEYTVAIMRAADKGV